MIENHIGMAGAIYLANLLHQNPVIFLLSSLLCNRSTKYSLQNITIPDVEHIVNGRDTTADTINAFKHAAVKYPLISSILHRFILLDIDTDQFDPSRT